MRSPPYPSDLTDEQWSVLEPLLPRAAWKCRPRQADLREVVNAIFYLNRAGCPWRMLPRDFPPWRTVYNYFAIRQRIANLFPPAHRLVFVVSNRQRIA